MVLPSSALFFQSNHILHSASSLKPPLVSSQRALIDPYLVPEPVICSKNTEHCLLLASSPSWCCLLFFLLALLHISYVVLSGKLQVPYLVLLIKNPLTNHCVASLVAQK